MKRFLVVMLAALLCSAAALADTAYVMCQPDSFVNARQFPKKDSAVAGRLELGDAVETDWKTRNGFVKVYGFENDAWVHMGYVSQSPVTVETVTGEISSKGRVACRRAINGTRRKWLLNGQKVVIYAHADDWSVTSEGFIQTRFLEGFCGKGDE